MTVELIKAIGEHIVIPIAAAGVAIFWIWGMLK